MVKRLGVLIVLACAFTAHAQDLTQLQRSQTALVGALNGVLGDPLEIVQYIPGYGFHYASDALFGDVDQAEIIETISNLLRTLGGTLQGLRPDDWISVYYRGDIGFTERYDLLIRMKPDQPDSLEVWLDGTRQ